MNNSENPLQLLQKKYDAQDIADMVEIVLQELKTNGFTRFFFSIKPMIKPYLFWSSVISLMFILFGDADLWTFFIPLLPVVILGVLFLIDFLMVTLSLKRAQDRAKKILGKEVSWDDIALAGVIAFAIREPFDEEDSDLNAPM